MAVGNQDYFLSFVILHPCAGALRHECDRWGPGVYKPGPHPGHANPPKPPVGGKINQSTTDASSPSPATTSSGRTPNVGWRANPSPYARFDRCAWDRLTDRTPLPLTQDDIDQIASLGDPIDMTEVDTIYRPLSALLQLYIDGRRRISAERRAFLGEPDAHSTPFVIGIAGSVAVGKSTVARLLQLLLSRWDSTPRVDLVTTDGFLYPNRILQERSLIARKGFPESYDRTALISFLAAVKAGNPHAKAPVYSHVTYDIVPGAYVDVDRPDILIVEGLNVLQPPRSAPGSVSVAVSDYFDFSIYVDADETHIEQWYVDRFLKLRATAFSREDSFFKTYASLTDTEAVSTAHMVWNAINLPNLRENIQPTRERATLIFTKGADHRVESLAIRKD